MAHSTHPNSRRAFLTAIGTAPLWSVRPATAAEIASAGVGAPPTLPGGLTAVVAAYVNWDGEIRIDQTWQVRVTAAGQVADLATWAAGAGWRLRAMGRRHNWSPLTIDATADTARVLLVDTSALAEVAVDRASRRVTAGAGATLDQIQEALKANGLAFAHAPAAGDLSIGGALAIGAHGSGVPAARESARAGWAFGSLSNAVVSLDAVVWDATTSRYSVRTFTRSDPATPALLCHLGRAFITRVTLQTGTSTRMRCRSHTTISMDALCARSRPWLLDQTVSSFLDSSGRVDILLFPFTATPWLKVWSLAPSWPLLSRPVSHPYNYAFADSVGGPVGDALSALTGPATPALGQLMWTTTTAGLTASLTSDIWGDPADVTRYVRPTTIKVTEAANAIVCRRSDVQRVLADFWGAHKARISRYALAGRYPVNNTVAIRVTGIDTPAQSPSGSDAPPALSATTAVPGRPELDTVVWISVLTLPGTRDADAFFAETENFLRTTVSGYAVVRPEWSKGWAYTASGAYTDSAALAGAIPASFGPAWASAKATLAALDPARIYASPLLDRLL